MIFNEGQSYAIKRIVEFSSSPNQPNVVPGITLVGEGGTGKSTCIMEAVSILIDQGYKVLLTAPTNKAVKQLVKSATHYGLDLTRVAFRTIHSAMSMTMLPNEDRKITHRSGQGILGNYDVLVIDEASMLGKRMTHEHLIPELQFLGIKVILMGDNKQLPPPKEAVSPCFTLFETITLKKVERFETGGGIDKIVQVFRDAIDGKGAVQVQGPFGADVQAVKPAHFTALLKEHFVPGVDLDNNRVLAWRNRRVAELNNIIRTNIYGKNPDRFYVGERVVTGGPVKIGDDIALGTDEECNVIQFRNSVVEEEQTGLEFKSYQLVLEPIHLDKKVRVVAHVVHEDDQDAYDEELARRARIARNAVGRSAQQAWGAFWSLKEMVSDIRYCACITVHRSQGSTFANTFVDVKDILGNNIRSERLRLLTVATSRPSSKLFLNKEKFTA